jgi:hypothetical protein
MGSGLAWVRQQLENHHAAGLSHDWRANVPSLPHVGSNGSVAHGMTYTVFALLDRRAVREGGRTESQGQSEHQGDPEWADRQFDHPFRPAWCDACPIRHLRQQTPLKQVPRTAGISRTLFS